MPNEIWKAVASAFGLLMVLVSAAVAVVSVSEIASRDSLASLIRQHENTLRTEYFEMSRVRSTSAVTEGSKGNPGAVGKAKEQNLADEIDALRVLEQQVRMLTSLGAENTPQTLDGIRRNFEQYRSNRDNRSALERISTDLAAAEIAATTSRNRITALDGEIEAGASRATQAKRAMDGRQAEYNKAQREFDVARSELRALERRAQFVKERLLSTPVPNETLKKEMESMPEKQEAALERHRAALERLERFDSTGLGSVAPAASTPMPSLPVGLTSQRAAEAEKLAQAEKNIEQLKVQRQNYAVSSQPPPHSQWWFIPRLHSDYLLAISIMSCSALGALIAGLRGTSRTSARDLILGIASGFVCYFAIKGGKYVFLLSSSAEYVTFNPYGSAFAGLLVGLFSDRVYGLLTALVGDLETRLKLAIASDSRQLVKPQEKSAT